MHAIGIFVVITEKGVATKPEGTLVAWTQVRVSVGDYSGQTVLQISRENRRSFQLKAMGPIAFQLQKPSYKSEAKGVWD